MKNINWSLFVLVSALLLGSCGNGTAVESTRAYLGDCIGDIHS